MSAHCRHCGASAGYGHEIGHRSDCSTLQPAQKWQEGIKKMSGPFPSAWQAGIDGSREDRRAERLTESRRQSEEAMRLVIAREIWAYQECPWDFDNPNDMMGELQKRIAIDQAERIRISVLNSAVFQAAFSRGLP